MKVLYTVTGSKGNCSVIENSNHDKLIIDAGLPFDKANSALDYNLYRSVGCILTHGHSDHISHLKDFVSAGIHVYALEDTLNEAQVEKSKRYFHPVAFNKTYSISGFKFVPIEMHHTNAEDFSVCPCAGYLIQDIYSGEKILWATDTFYISQRFPPLEYYAIECNYFESDNWSERVEYVEKVVEQRRMSSHMSFETALKFINMQDLSKCKAIYLLHLSTSLTKEQRNSIASQFKKKIKKKGVKVYA